MLFYNEVEYYEEPIAILEKIKKEYVPTLMSKNDLSFLCGMLKKYRPSKIVEVGVAYGGTTAVIANCLAELNYKCEMHSVDILENFRGDKPGAYFDAVKEHIDLCKIEHKFYLGNPAPYFMDQIGGEIDFLILDTSHGLPGELLEFITFLPYLSKNAVVVLHDIVDHLVWQYNNGYEYATQLLFDCVVADKYMVMDTDRKYSYPNISAFIVNEDTRKYIDNCFGAMNMTWLYMPSDEEYQLYVNLVQKNYGEQYVDILEYAKKLNALHFERQYEKKKLYFQRLWNNNIYIYGAGDIGQKCKKILNDLGIKENGFVVSDNQNINDLNKKIYHLSEVERDKWFIIAVGDVYLSEMKANLQECQIDKYIEWGEFLSMV